MRKDLIHQLHEQYPEAMSRRTAVECGDGWHGILLTLLRLTPFVEPGRKAPRLLLAKEKMGQLSLHFRDELTPAQLALCHYAEVHSGRTCEVCGAPGELRTDGWLRTRCEQHAQPLEALLERMAPESQHEFQPLTNEEQLAIAAAESPKRKPRRARAQKQADAVEAVSRRLGRQ